MMGCHCGDLRQMRDADHLVVISDHRHLLRHLLRRPSADPHINLIKNQCLNVVPTSHDRLNGEHDPG